MILQQDTHKLALVEDDERLAALVSEYLQQNGFETHLYSRGDLAVPGILQLQPDIVILDIMLPGLDGFSVCREIRREYDGPVLMLTAKDEDIDQILGLEIGADDYVVKPVEPRLLLARLRTLLRRSQPVRHNTQKLRFGGLQIDMQNREVRLEQQSIELTTAEFNLLCLLAQNPGKVLSRDDILKHLRGFGYNGIERSVDINISRLRKKLNDNSHKPTRIKTIRAQGYLFAADAWERT